MLQAAFAPLSLIACCALIIYLATSNRPVPPPTPLEYSTPSTRILLLPLFYFGNMDSSVFYALGPLAIWLVVKSMRIGRRESYLPNGPPTVPILGNLNIFPKVEAHLKYSFSTVPTALRH
jgi:hypothetical protein